jgi:hypothetical protein
MLPCGNAEGPVRNLDKLDDGASASHPFDRR